MKNITQLKKSHSTQHKSNQPHLMTDRQTELDWAGSDLCNSSRVRTANLPALQAHHNSITKGWTQWY